METTTIEQQKSEDLEGLRCYELNSSLCKLVNVGMYNSLISPEAREEDAQENLIEEFGDAGRDLVCFGKFDMDEYKKDVQRCAAEIIDEYAMPILENYGVAAIKTTGIWSPKYYNYETDQLDFNVYLADDFDEKFKENMDRFRTNPALKQYIKDHWCNRPGFFSYMPRSMDDIASFRDEERCLACYLTFALLTEGYWDNFPEQRSDLELYYKLGDWVSCMDYADVYLYCSEEWAKIYDDRLRMKDLCRKVSLALGHPWENHQRENMDLGCRPDNEAAKLVIWATDKGYSPKDLLGLCAA